MSRQPVKYCTQCGLIIPERAELCHHCNSYQDWRGKISVSSSVLALLVALVSVSSTAMGLLIKAAKDQYSKVSLSNAVVRDDALYLIATNSGNRPGILASAVARDGPFKNAAATLTPSTASDVFINPGAQRIALKIGIKMNKEDAQIWQQRAINQWANAHYTYADVRFKQTTGDQIATSRVFLSGGDVYSIVHRQVVRCVGAALAHVVDTACIAPGKESQAYETDLRRQLRASQASGAGKMTPGH